MMNSDSIVINGVKYLREIPMTDSPGMVPVLVTTEFRGVFFGFATSSALAESPENLTLREARNCIYWSAAEGGLFGLAVTGPNSDCRIGAKVSSVEVRKVTSVTRVEAVAAEVWANAKTYVG